MDSAVPPSVSFGVKYSSHEELRASGADLQMDLKRTIDRIDAMDENLTFRLHQLELRVAETKADLIRWSFVFWVGAVAAVAALAGVLRGI